MRCNYCHHESHPNLHVALTTLSGDLIARESMQIPNPPARGSWTVALDLPKDDLARPVVGIVGDRLMLTVTSNGRTDGV